MKFLSKDDIYGERRVKMEVGQHWIDEHTSIIVKILEIGDKTVKFLYDDKKSLENEFGEGSREVKDLFNTKDEAPISDFIKGADLV